MCCSTLNKWIVRVTSKICSVLIYELSSYASIQEWKNTATARAIQNWIIMHHLQQVPQDEWGGYPGEKDEEIPCRRMRSSSYVKAMGEVDDDSGDSDSSLKTPPQKAVRPDALVLKSAMQRPHFDPQR